jgi:predicted phage baseplate assembly protein
VSVVRGNVVLVDHGRSRSWCDGDPEHIPVPPDAVDTPSCARPDFGCGDRVEPGPVLRAIQELLTAAGAGRPLTGDELTRLVPLVGQPALDRAGLAADDPAHVQALALQALLAQISYPSIATRFGPVLPDSPVTQRNPYPSPELVALSQARALDAIPGLARDRVTEIWRQAGEDLDAQLRAELTLLFGPAAIAEVRLTEHPARGLSQLLARFDELLAGKLTRLVLLAARARDGNVLGGAVVWEIQQTWGERYATGLDPADPALAGPASALAVQDPRTALPAVRLVGTDARGEPAGTWLPRRDLLASGPRDQDFVGEVGDDGRLALRFGTAPHGVAPPAGGELLAYYRVGNGTAGNVGAEAVNHLVLCAGVDADGVSGVRNPLPATGGTDPEPLAVVRQMAPLALHRTRLRAVTAADYADLAGRVPGVQRAAAQLRWTGAVTEVHVAVDPLGPGAASDALLTVVAHALEAYRRIGHDVVVGPAQLVPLDVALRVLVDDGYDRGHVVTALRSVLSAGRLSGGGLGFFHPDALTFGEPVRVSRLVAAAAAVPGVLSAEVTRLRPLFRPDGAALAAGLLRLGPLEIAECDNLADQPERGRLSVIAEGGR